MTDFLGPQILTPVETGPEYKITDYLTKPYFISELANHDPLVLSAPEWSLHIQSKPKARIYRTGRIPTYQEIGETLRHVNAPVWSIELFQVLIELAEVES